MSSMLFVGIDVLRILIASKVAGLRVYEVMDDDPPHNSIIISVNIYKYVMDILRKPWKCCRVNFACYFLLPMNTLHTLMRVGILR